MKNKSYYLLILLTIIIISFPSICFSELKTVEGEYCDVYLGDMKNKRELDDFKKTVKTKSIQNGIYKLGEILDPFFDIMKPTIKNDCYSYIINNYLEKIVVISHTEKDRKICDKVKITTNSEVIKKYFSQEKCYTVNPYSDLEGDREWNDINDVLIKKNDKINICLIIETKIPDLEITKKEQLENEQEQWFFYMIERNKEKYKVVDRRHLKNIIEEQKLSSSGLTDSETVKLGKLLNLDIIVLRLIYEKNSRVSKVLKVDTGEVLLFKTYETKKNEKTITGERWILYGTNETGFFYYDNNSITNVSPKIMKVWSKRKFSEIGKDDEIKWRKENKLSIVGWEKIDNYISLYELDCENNTFKEMKFVNYDNEGNSLSSVDVPNPKIRQMIPGSISELLIKKVCKK